MSAVIKYLVNNQKWMITSVYRPNSRQRRSDPWRELDAIRGNWNCQWCVGGDWNAVRFPSERSDEQWINANIRAFSDWINSHSLVDL